MKSLRILFLLLLAGGIIHAQLPCEDFTAENTAAASKHRNLLANGNFEKGTEGWELIAFQKQGKMMIDSVERHNGRPSLRIDNAVGDHSFVRQIIQGKPNTRYRLSGYIKTNVVEAVREGGLDGAVLMIGMTLNMTHSIQGTTSWRRVSVDFTTTDNTEIRVGPSLGTYARSVTGTAWFSDLSLIELAETPAPHAKKSVVDAKAAGIPVPERAKVFLDPVEMLLKSAPASAIQTLRDDPEAEDAAAEVNRYFREYAIDKSIVLHTTVEAAQAHPDVRNAFRIRAASAPLEWEGRIMKRLSWLYFKPADAPVANSVKVGSAITVVGWIRRCEVVNVQGGLRLNFDLQSSRIEDSSNPLPTTGD